MMDDHGAARIGIFEYDWSMYSFIKDFIVNLAEAGYKVDIFQKDPSATLDFTNPELFRRYRNVRYINLNPSNTLTRKIMQKLKVLLGRLDPEYRQNPKSFIDGGVLLRSKEIVSESKYQCFIGVEKKGLIWAGILSQIYKCPLVYYSLELYVEDHPDIKEYAYLRKAEKKYHQLAGATIIQDERRAKTLMEYNEVKDSDKIYFPISVRGATVETKSGFFHQKYKIEEAKKIILYFGLIQDERFSADLVRIANQMKNDLMIVLHGFGDQTYLKHLRSVADGDRVMISSDLVAEEQILDVISSATIGLALYEDTSSNDRLAAFSSVKVAYYMQCGVPVIAFDSESFRELMSAHKCGELIRSIDEIPQKVEKILADYDSYREQAFMAHRQFYDFDRNFKKFLLDFDGFIKNRCAIENRDKRIYERQEEDL